MTVERAGAGLVFVYHSHPAVSRKGQREGQELGRLDLGVMLRWKSHISAFQASLKDDDSLPRESRFLSLGLIVLFSMTRETALASAREVASYLKRVHGATRVLLFGSVTKDTFLSPPSDIDLFVEGLPYDQECLITGKTFLRFVDLDIDLIPSGHAPESLKQEILKSGIAL
jgi:predicted nucleotidyltransferase